jgi:hypothetical protein
MAWSGWSSKEKLEAICDYCSQPIVYYIHPTLGECWGHSEGKRHAAKPILHTLDSVSIEITGYKHGIGGASILDNPYYPEHPLYDEASPQVSLLESEAWHLGWVRAQRELGNIPPPKVLEQVVVDEYDDLFRPRQE